MFIQGNWMCFSRFFKIYRIFDYVLKNNDYDTPGTYNWFHLANLCTTSINCVHRMLVLKSK